MEVSGKIILWSDLLFPYGCGDMTQSPPLVQKENKSSSLLYWLASLFDSGQLFSRVSYPLSSLSNIHGCVVPWEPRHTLYVVRKSRPHQSHSRLAVHSPVIIVSLSQRKMILPQTLPWWFSPGSCQREGCTIPLSPPPPIPAPALGLLWRSICCLVLFYIRIKSFWLADFRPLRRAGKRSFS